MFLFFVFSTTAQPYPKKLPSDDTKVPTDNTKVTTDDTKVPTDTTKVRLTNKDIYAEPGLMVTDWEVPSTTKPTATTVHFVPKLADNNANVHTTLPTGKSF